MWVGIEQRGKPSTWITLRGLRVVKGAEATLRGDVAETR